VIAGEDRQPTAPQYLAALERAVRERTDLELTRRPIAGQPYPLTRLASRGQGPLMLLVAGIHGDEIAGPLTLLRQLHAMAQQAHDRGIGLIVYPLVNPAAFQARTRHGPMDGGSCGTNDFLRYELDDGSLLDDIGSGRRFTRWHWSSAPGLGLELPAATVALHRALRADPLRRVVAAVDLHQDHITPVDAPLAYHYAFGDLSRYAAIVARLRQIITLASGRTIDAGQASPMQTDEQGFIVRHDGTVTDLLHRLGAGHAVTVETTGNTPLELALRVNQVWIEGLLEQLGP